MHNPDTKRFVLCLPYGAAPDNVVGAVRLRLFVPFELIQVCGRFDVVDTRRGPSTYVCQERVPAKRIPCCISMRT